ncbi:Ferric iron ABC transporter, permease protein [Rubrivivax sp. A210]|uniref:putative 2-aminoethylphosphonate ABC transporter permease subunit n=1 Tax=Rubrivivax sp. A210 TaxID=2772301 RepID=UPI0019190CD6|nr:putative 2-aminoethylphosphonate ABC transporter permease subunit [Rubrivivax sp. A210]CAD5373457.1 Ferric iron ABC transporter, permease protein [Rubrivivax sp. A210]
MSVTALAGAGVRHHVHWTERLAHAALLLVALALLAFLAAPLATILQKSVQDGDGRFVALANFIAYAQTPSLLQSLGNSLWVSALVTVVTVPLAFGFAYALARSCMPLKGLARTITLVPLLAPSLLSAISLIYWFGNQGVLKGWMLALGVEQIYGAPGIVLAEIFSTFPHALMILVTALAAADARLYEAADAMGTSVARKFFTITLPGAKYGLISAALVTFTLVVTDFGIPKVIGGNFNVLATDVFKLVIGQQDFQKGAVVALLLLAPAVLTFAVDRWVGRKQTAMLTARAVPYRAKPAPAFDALMSIYCAGTCVLILAMLGMAVFASFATFWPYNLQPSLRHYTLGLVDAEVGVAFVNSLKVAGGTAVFGTLLVFVGAYLLEKTAGLARVRVAVRLLALLPMAVPGLVLGLGYIFFFNAPANPLGGLYHTVTLLTVCTVVHFYTTGHLTAVTALKALDPEFEAVSASMKVPFYKTFWRVTLPICTPALVDIARYFFINAMTTISAVVFLYSPETKVASIAILNLDEAGEIGAAAACAVLIAAANTVATLLFMGLSRWVDRRTQAWKTH